MTASPSHVIAGEPVTFYANASSDLPPSTNLTFTIFYDYYDSSFNVNPDSPVTVNITGNPGSVVVTHTYDRPATNFTQPSPYYWANVFVDDGTSNYSSGTGQIQVFVSPPPVNMPPSFLTTPPDPLSADSGAAHYMAIEIADPDGDTVTVHWDFGDGTNATNVTVAPPTGVWISQNHTWYTARIPGMGNYVVNFTLNVSLSDGHNPPVNSSTPVQIKVQFNWPPNLQMTPSTSSASLSEPINFTAMASDKEGDPLTWTFNYSDGTVSVRHTGYTAPGVIVWQNTTHSFTAVGNYTVAVSVSDVLVPSLQVTYHNITVTATIQVTAKVAPMAGTMNVYPGSPIINGTSGYVNVTVSIQAWEPDGDMFNLTWDFGVLGTRTNNSVGDAARRMFPSLFIQVLAIDEPGSYPITVTITDGLPGHQVLRTTLVNVTSNNRPPTVLGFDHDPYALGDFASPNETVKFNLVMTDREHDAIEVIWNFGDGSPKVYMNLTDYDANWNITVHVNHTYVLKGNYTLSIVVTDNKIGAFNHTYTYTIPIVVSVRPPVPSKAWSWWDYTSLALFMMIPIGCVAWYFYLRWQRKSIEDRGMTVDEWKIRKEMGGEELGK